MTEKHECPNNPGIFCGDHEEIIKESASNKATIKVAAFFVGGIISASFFFTLIVKGDLAEAHSKNVAFVEKKFERQDREIMTIAKTAERNNLTVMKLVEEMKVTNQHLWDLKTQPVSDAM